MILRSGSPAELLRALETLQPRRGADSTSRRRRDAATPFVSHRLAEQRVSLSERRRASGREPLLKSLIATRPVILPSAESGLRIGFDALVDRLGIRPQIAAEVDDMAMMRLMTREDVGLAVLPPIVVKDELEAGLLIEAGTLPGIVEAFFAVTLERRFPNPMVRVLIEQAAAASD